MRTNQGWTALLCAVALAGCKQESPSGQGAPRLQADNVSTIATTPRKAAPPTVRSAAILGCDPAEVFDSGHVTYVVVPEGCQPSMPMQLEFDWGTAKRQVRKSQQFSGFDEAIPFSFTPDTLEEPPGERVISVHQATKWRSFPNEGNWVWRDGAGLLSYKGALYLLGGWNGDGQLLTSEVWRTYDLENWELLTDSAPWPIRHGAGWVVHNDRMYVIGGDFRDDAWSSDDGLNWRQEAIAAPFGGRYTPSVVSDGHQLLLYGGQYWDPASNCGAGFGVECAGVGYNDVWASDDGTQWRQVLAQAPWAPRGLVHGGAFFNGRVYVVGGGLKGVASDASYAETVAEFTDIWSSADGVDWRLEATELGFTPRTHFTLLATRDGCYVANGSVSTQVNTSSEVFFAPDCVHFTEVFEPSTMGIRHASSVAEFNGSIVVLGGHRATAGTRIWQFFPRRNSLATQ
jgi:hypothetical protein